MRGGEANCLAIMGGVVSPLRQKKLSSLLTVKGTNPRRYGEKTTFS